MVVRENDILVKNIFGQLKGIQRGKLHKFLKKKKKSVDILIQIKSRLVWELEVSSISRCTFTFST